MRMHSVPACDRRLNEENTLALVVALHSVAAAGVDKPETASSVGCERAMYVGCSLGRRRR